jgi:fructokinase
MARLGAIEAGGTKFVCAVGTPDGELLRQSLIPTGAPAETMERIRRFFQSEGEALAAVGIGSFGPLELDRGSSQYGYITSTPKSDWRHFDLLGAVRDVLQVPVALDTDVNAAALAESIWGAAQGHRNFLYVTVGTGIGGAAMIDGSILHGLSHPEMGHVRVPHDRTRDPFPGTCPYHGDCLEGLASGVAIEARWQTSPPMLPPDHQAWLLEAEYLALGCVNWICNLVPQKLVFGGGVMRTDLFPPIRSRVQNLMNGYLDLPQLTRDIDRYLVPSALGGSAGVLGALILASREAGLGEIPRRKGSLEQCGTQL